MTAQRRSRHRQSFRDLGKGPGRWRLSAAAWLVIWLVWAAPASSAGQLPAGRSIVTYTVPVHGPVVDPFRPPAHFGGPGNRGLEFGNPLWAPVVAAADGRVTFAGPVFGNGTVVVEHADGVRTTYNGLTELWVAAGQTVSQLDGLGMAGTNVHFGALRGNVYIDPQILIDASQSGGAVRLVPLGD